jgi:hypothetical protein
MLYRISIYLKQMAHSALNMIVSLWEMSKERNIGRLIL